MTAAPAATTARRPLAGAGARRSLAALLAAVVGLAAACTPAAPVDRDAEVARLVGFVERTRGHQFVTDPAVVFTPEAEFRQLVLDDVESAQPDIDAVEPVFHALGWLRPNADLFAAYRTAFGSGVMGFYDPSTGELRVRGHTLTAYRKEVIVHELTHALDDQVVGLDVEFDDGVLGQQTFAALVAIEGSAAYVQNRYVNAAPAAERLASLGEQLSAGSDPKLLSVPIALLLHTQVPYLQGPAFIGQLTRSVGPTAIDRALGDLPDTSEQAFDVGDYLDPSPIEAVAVPPADGAVASSGTGGTWLLSLVLGDGVATGIDRRTSGWAGDSWVSWRTATGACVRFDVVMDTSTQADTLTAGLTTVAARGTAGSGVERTGDRGLRATVCR